MIQFSGVPCGDDRVCGNPDCCGCCPTDPPFDPLPASCATVCHRQGRGCLCSSAHSSQMETPFSLSHPTLVSPFRNHKSSYMMDLRCNFLVVHRGKSFGRVGNGPGARIGTGCRFRYGRSAGSPRLIMSSIRLR